MDYSKDWETIALAIKNEADWHCVECGRPCRRPGQRWLDFANALVDWGYGEELTDPQRFTLTVVHSDHNPANPDRSNVRALCAPCASLSRHSLKLKSDRTGAGTIASKVK